MKTVAEKIDSEIFNLEPKSIVHHEVPLRELSLSNVQSMLAKKYFRDALLLEAVCDINSHI